MDVNTYIKENWIKSVRDGARKGLPYPFTSPSCEQTSDVGFENFFYWDTYFINIGLLSDGMVEQVKNNLQNLVYLLDKYGYIPNVATEGGDNRSQLPLFTLMCHAYFQYTGDEVFFRAIYPAMEKEYEFWMRERMAPCGLNRYGNNADDDTCINFYRAIKAARLGGDMAQKDENARMRGSHLLSEAESGWDFTPRFGMRAEYFAPIDLNCIAYENECILSNFAPDGERALRYRRAAEDRKRNIEKICLHSGIYCDYDFVHNKHSEIASVAQLFPYLCGVSNDGEGAIKILSRLEMVYGVSTTEKTADCGKYQWSYPNVWPPLQYFAVTALDRVGRKDDAFRIAQKYLSVVEKSADDTDSLWEKYDCNCGCKALVNEYAESKMLGWTAGTYRALQHYVRTGKPIHDFVI